MSASAIGWDIGGVNTKVARAVGQSVAASRIRPFEIQREPDRLPDILMSLAEEVGAQSTDIHAVTMTAELSQAFRTKREGVEAVLNAVEKAFPAAAIRVYSTG